MSRYLVGPTALLVTLSVTQAALCSAERGTPCTLDPNWTGDTVAIRSAPNNSANVLKNVKQNTGEIREVDIVSRGPSNNDWIKVTSGEVNGWVDAAALVCRLTPQEARTEIAAETAAVIEALAQKDMDTLAKYVHPIKGVRFSPSATIGATADVVLSSQSIRHWFQNTEKRTWGSDDAKGEPIRLTEASYYARFIYDRNYRSAPVIGFNTAEAKSTDQNNVWEVYPNSIVVEYYFPPSVPDGNNWASLRLVYEKHQGQWFLSGVIHDAWTI
jgi:hypothetical protein